MPSLDASGLAQLAVRLSLISEDQWRECWEDLDPKTVTPEALLRHMERKAILTPWQAAKLIKEDKDGYLLGGYRLLYRIAAGTFGRVYRADNPRTGEIVAIKVLRRKWSNDARKIELFEREGKVGMSLSHPNIVQILNVSQDPVTSQYYIVMEFVEGGNLRDILSIRKKLAPEEALRILEECASGLAYACSRGLTHRDIKPSNILISTQGATAKLVDFGLAEITGTRGAEDDGDTAVDRTVDYAGLERATGVKAGDVRSDIYFLGCVFYEMLTGRPLLTVTKDLRARMQGQRYEVVRDLRRDDPDLPPPVYSLLQRMSAYDPLERLQTPNLLVDAVKQTRREISGEAVHDSTPGGPRTVFVVEHHPRLQDAFREKLKQIGFRVLISIDAARALQRYQQHPFHALIVDVGTAGEAGISAMEDILREAERQRLQCKAILILSEDQALPPSRLKRLENATVLVRPVTMKQITALLRNEEAVAESGEDAEE